MITEVFNGADLRAWRNQRNMTQETLSGLLGVHRGTVSNYEIGAISLPLNIHTRLNEADDVYGPEYVEEQLETGEIDAVGLIYWRKMHDLSLTKAGTILGTSGSTVSKYEKGTIKTVPERIVTALLKYEGNNG
jgi:transcriptional regulator with XRE-family HTH domain